MSTTPPAYTLFAVDDTESARRIIAAAFADDYVVDTFASSEEALTCLQMRQPDLLLLDVGLPGIDGYTMCRMMKQNVKLSSIPVIFISARDDLESCLAGYDAGGIDFIVKPYNIKELRQKVRVTLHNAAHHAALHQQVADSATLSALLMANLDEFSLLIGFLRELNASESPLQVTETLFALVAKFRLDAAIQLRVGRSEETHSPLGEAPPLEVSVIRHIRVMGRIVEYRNRLAYNDTHITLLINNMPESDGELCGRLRDHLAVAVESANSRLEALQARVDKASTADGILLLLQTLQATVADFSRRYDSARYRGSTLTQALADELTAAFAYLGMSAEQEERIQAIVQGRTDGLIELYDFGDELQSGLHHIHQHLCAMLVPQD